MFPGDVRLYPLTDIRLSGLSHAEQVARLSEGGAHLIQLREKYLSPREFYDQAVKAMRVARSRGVRIIINDRIDVAMASKADGVHLGQDDFPPQAARRLLGDGAIIGLSTHNVDQAVQASTMDIDYIAVGPIFGTSTKDNPDPVVGLTGLEEIRQAVLKTPIVAIGGITSDNAPQVMKAGANAVAVISALLIPPDETIAQTKRFIAQLSGLA
ncbi:MAG TPA: thiamine phosphate synthase [Pyrinomonadaceae bacterium]|nr:thiamine phosphate synthase [Pyrinomonadaceae bacterium]